MFVMTAREERMFHVSEDAGIDRFEPRVARPGGEALVWAIDEEHLRNYGAARLSACDLLRRSSHERTRSQALSWIELRGDGD